MATYNQVKSALYALPHKELVLATCEIVREQSWHLIKDERSKKAVESAEGYVTGTVTKNELGVARFAAYDACNATANTYDSTTYAAYNSATSNNVSAVFTAYIAHTAASAAFSAVSVAYAYSYTAYTASAAYASYAASYTAYASDDTTDKLRDRQLEIIAKYAKEKPSKK